MSGRQKTLDGHRCSGAVMKFEVYCECGWISCPHKERAQAYAEWRYHVAQHRRTPSPDLERLSGGERL